MYQTVWKGKSRQIQSPLAKASAHSLYDMIDAALPILWEEHCTECAVPECYSSCQLYVAREDRKCARFVEGIFPNEEFSGLLPFGADIQFRRWGKLQAKLPITHEVIDKVKIRAWSESWIQLQNKALNLSRKSRQLDSGRKLVGASRLMMHKKLEKTGQSESLPDGFILECFLDGVESHGLILEGSSNGRPSFRRVFQLDPGWNSFFVHYASLGLISGSETSLEISIDQDKTPRIVFTYLDLVKFIDRHNIPAEKVKCVAWDLDHTIWDGVIGDDGKDLDLVPGVLNLIKEFDRRGIIQVVLSKNEERTALDALKLFGLDSFFVGHGINWNPKSTNLINLADELNIGVDSFALIDDSAFERREVSLAIPSVRVYRPVDFDAIASYDEFNPDLSSESKNRRVRYQEEKSRKQERMAWEGSYETFLKSCQQKLDVGKVGEEELERCLELLQRSNQFNLSGRRYDLDKFRDLQKDPKYNLRYLKLSDSHGDYGIVGFCSYKIEGEDIRIQDFVFSCRAAEKKVERAFFESLFESESKKKMVAALTASPRNAPLRRVLDEIGFRETGFDHGTKDVILLCPAVKQTIIEVNIL